jgi:aromatic-L-amino-acid decarboxylase
VDASENPLELDEDEMRDMVEAALDRVVDHLGSLDAQRAGYDEDPASVARAFREAHPPEEGASLEALLAELFDGALPPSLNTPHPGYLAYIPGGGIFPAAVADLIADAVNRYVGTWFAAPALTQIEANVVEWLCRIVGYPDPAFGVLTTGGSMANQTAITTARRELLGEDTRGAVLYVSDQAHHSLAKSAVLSGFPAENVRSVPTDEAYRLRPDALETAIEEDRAAGRRPFLVVANVGSTNTGAVDPLPAIADVAERDDLWLHADACYGGFFVLTERGRERLAGLDRADTITLDPHKGLFLPYGTGAVLAREGAALKRAHQVTADYIPDPDDGHEVVDFSQHSPELSRDFRGLRVWLPLKLHGLQAFRDNLDEKLGLARQAADGIQAMDGVRLVAEPQLSTLAFRAEPDGIGDEALDRVNRAWLDRVNELGRVHLSGTTLDDRFTLRISVLSFRTHEDDIRRCLEDLETTLDAALATAR